MIQKTFTVKDLDELRELADRICNDPGVANAADQVLLTWAQYWDADEFALLREEIYRLFPSFTTIGSNYYSYTDIQNGTIDGKSAERSIMLTFLFFEDAHATLLHPETGQRQEEATGKELSGMLSKIPDIKGIYLVPPFYFCSSEEIIREALKGREEIPVFGIKTSLLFEYQTFGYESEGPMFKQHLFALVFHGQKLRLRLHYNLGWTPIGRIMQVTKEENPFFVDEIDEKPASHIYNKYLGLQNDQIIPENLSEFPLIIFRDNLKISRIGITGQKEGQLVFGAPVYLHDQISLSYGNPDDLFAEIKKDCAELVPFSPQAGLLIACANRIMLLKEREHEEIENYRRLIPEAAAVYGYAELFYSNGKGGEMNSALVSVAFSEESIAENQAEGLTELTGRPDGVSKPETIPEKQNKIVPFTDRLSRFFKEMSGDLLQAVQAAETANRSKSAFYSCISHEFRTPLNVILGMNEMIRQETETASVREYTGNIESAGKMLLQLVNDILDTEKIEAGKMEIIPSDYNPRQMIRELVKMISFAAKEKDLKFLLKVEGTLPTSMYGDETRLRQCILNLLNNAVKYTKKGEVCFTVSVRKTDETHASLYINVRDTGIGIKPEDVKKLSQPFTRVDQARNRGIEGTGLGLNIVKNLLELMGSSLKIQSTYGEGSEFSFLVIQELRSPNSTDTQAEPAPRQSAQAPERMDTAHGSLLVVDDTPMNIDIIKLFLKKSGLNIDSAPSGPVALDMLRKAKYDIIFLDLRMPDMDGIETFQRAKADPKSLNQDSVFIMLTADDREEGKERFLAEGFHDFLAKPVKITDLNALIQKYLG
ncbi:MAG: response regulator [Lachnospiraceae bacterium]|nr:response regulator [Lachnospiraceae bacterium]